MFGHKPTPFLATNEPLTHGAEATHSGSFLEKMIEHEFNSRGVQSFYYSEQGDNGHLFVPHFLLKRVPYTSIYGARSISEFLYRHYNLSIEVRIECRWQETAGSVDEKFPYLLVNAEKRMPEPIIWLVVSGGGARGCALQWLKREARAVEHKAIHVYGDMAEVRKAIKELLRTVRQRTGAA